MILAFGRRGLFAAVLLFAPGLGGCVSFYVDSSVKEAAAEDRAKVANPRPVQLLFEFQTKGIANSQATQQVHDTAVASVFQSGLFSQVLETPAPDGALLHITINNVPLTNDAEIKGFVTGFTFGLVGSSVADGYICTIEFVPRLSGQALTVSGRDAIYASFGTAGPPPNARKVSNATEAINTVMRRMIANELNDLAKKQDFPK